MADDVFLCFSCGKRNRVTAGSNRSLAKCGSCGEALFPEEAEKPKAAQRKTAAPARPTDEQAPWERQKSNRRLGSKLFWVAVILGGGVWLIYENAATSPRSTAPLPRTFAPAASATSAPAPAVTLPPPVFQSAGVMWNRTGRPLEAPLEIRTSAGADYYVKLVDAFTNRDAVAIFVNGGRSIEVQVPLGSYKFRYATGEVWRGEVALFGPGNLTSYSEAGSRFEFEDRGSYISGFTVELIRQVNGNLSTRQIDASQF